MGQDHELEPVKSGAKTLPNQVVGCAPPGESQWVTVEWRDRIPHKQRFK